MTTELKSSIRLRLVTLQRAVDAMRGESFAIMGDGDCPQSFERTLTDAGQRLGDVGGDLELLLERAGWES